MTFQNPWPGQPRGFKDVLRWRFRDRLQDADRTEPSARLAAAAHARRSSSPRADPGYRSATWVGHSTVLLQLGGAERAHRSRSGASARHRCSADRSAAIDEARRRLRRAATDRRRSPVAQSLRSSRRSAPFVDSRRTFPDAARGSAHCGLGGLLRSLLASAPSGGARLVADGRGRRVFSATCTPAQHFSARGLQGSQCIRSGAAGRSSTD